ncbi:hypothetical protein F2P56_028095 [Juglans regia]|uniref:Btz domain-containing protein n=2 Tax=Juglans regia TaxID=51240 RepID=A0A833TS30_JUGRE|nr:protein MLN51 homolog isoform X2 [Juglans regia]KAF5453170.1 hypothetical protein F2P56_028095 [Juglans regia]
MATAGEEEVEYESDPEEVKRSLAMRRREASDDEEGEGGGREKPRMDRRVVTHSDESDGQGGVAEYEDDEELDEEEEQEDEEDEEGEVELDGDAGEEEEELYGDRRIEGETRVVGGDELAVSRLNVNEAHSDERRSADDLAEVQEEDRGEGEEKKENEPFAVPTAGAFYMHDDRFRDNAGGRPRRTHGGRRLWESQDDRKWGHDKFEELTFQERHYEEGRINSKGHYRGRGKNQSVDRGYSRGSRSKVYNNQSQAPKSVRGRGPRRFEPTFKNKSQARPTERKQSGKPPEKTSHANSGRAFMPVSSVESESVPARRQVFASSLNSASPPFYPSGSSNKDITLMHKRDVQAGSSNRSFHPTVMDDGSSVQQANASRRGKNIAESVGMDKLFIDESINPGAGKPMTNSQIPLSGPSFLSVTQYPPTRPPGRGLAIAGQRSPAQSRVQPSVQAPAQQASQRPGSGSQPSSPPKTGLSISSYEPREAESPSESSKSKVALVGNGKVNAQSAGRGSVVYGGAQVMGATGSMAVGHGDQNLPGAPAFLPVMQFGGQHPGGIGVPAVGMAFPGYVAQPQLGLGNSEMTWLPVLAGAAGALGATYCSPYVVDGAYHARPTGQTSATGASSQENNLNKTNKEWKPSQRPEPGNDEFGQRQNKPRRYSEMSFGQ